MSGPIFNTELCLGCGLCALDCGMIVLDAKGKGNVPVMPFPDICLQCGHCVSVCPNEAVSHPEMEMNNFKSIEQLPDSDAVKMLLASKRSVRQFSKKPIEKETIEELVQTACMAPSDLNSQNREFIVLTDQKKINELEYAIVEGFKSYVQNALELGESPNSPQIMISQNIIYHYKNGGFPIFKNAPCVLFVCGPKQEQELFAPINIVTANTYLMIHAHSMGIGSCIIGRALYNTEFLANYFKISSDLKIYTAITLGYPKVKYRKTVDRKPHSITWIE